MGLLPLAAVACGVAFVPDGGETEATGGSSATGGSGNTANPGGGAASASGGDGGGGSSGGGGAAVAPGPNLLANGDMEQGGGAPWEHWPDVTTTIERVQTPPPHGGGWSLSLCGDAFEPDFTLFADVPGDPFAVGTEVEGWVWARAKPGSATPDTIHGTFREKTPGGNLDDEGVPITALGDTWTKVPVSGTVDAADTTLMVFLVWATTSGSLQSCFLLDDAYLYVVP